MRSGGYQLKISKLFAALLLFSFITASFVEFNTLANQKSIELDMPGLIPPSACPVGAVKSTDQFATGVGIPNIRVAIPYDEVVAGTWVIANNFVPDMSILLPPNCGVAARAFDGAGLNLMAVRINTTISSPQNADIQYIKLVWDVNANGLWDPLLDLVLQTKPGSDLLNPDGVLFYNGPQQPIAALSNSGAMPAVRCGGIGIPDTAPAVGIGPASGTNSRAGATDGCYIALLAIVKIGNTPINRTQFGLQLKAYSGDIPGTSGISTFTFSSGFSSSLNPQASNATVDIFGGLPGVETPFDHINNGAGNPESSFAPLQFNGGQNGEGLLTRFRAPKVEPGTREAIIYAGALCDGGFLATNLANILPAIAGAPPTMAGGLGSMPCVPSAGTDGFVTGLGIAILKIEAPPELIDLVGTVRMYADLDCDGVLFEPGEEIQQRVPFYNEPTREMYVFFNRDQNGFILTPAGVPLAGGCAAVGVAPGADASPFPLIIIFTADINNQSSSGRVGGHIAAQQLGGPFERNLDPNGLSICPGVVEDDFRNAAPPPATLLVIPLLGPPVKDESTIYTEPIPSCTPVFAPDFPGSSPLPGDANGDGEVNGMDLLTWKSHFGSPGSFEDGDFNGDGTVDAGDFLIWQNNFGAVEIDVDSNAAGRDVDPNDGICDADPGPAVLCTPGAAVDTARNSAGDAVINLPPGANRWGDYSGLNFDPPDNNSFWYIQGSEQGQTSLDFGGPDGAELFGGNLFFDNLEINNPNGPAIQCGPGGSITTFDIFAHEWGHGVSSFPGCDGIHINGRVIDHTSVGPPVTRPLNCNDFPGQTCTPFISNSGSVLFIGNAPGLPGPQRGGLDSVSDYDLNLDGTIDRTETALADSDLDAGLIDQDLRDAVEFARINGRPIRHSVADYDFNENGRIDEEELEQAQQDSNDNFIESRLFSRLVIFESNRTVIKTHVAEYDQNKNGFIEPHELASLEEDFERLHISSRLYDLVRSINRDQTRIPRSLFDYDANENGEIDGAEVNRAQQDFDNLLISEELLRAMLAGPARRDRLPRSASFYDTNRDGIIDEFEFVLADSDFTILLIGNELLHAIQDSMALETPIPHDVEDYDVNGNGSIDEAERAAAVIDFDILIIDRNLLDAVEEAFLNPPNSASQTWQFRILLKHHQNAIQFIAAGLGTFPSTQIQIFNLSGSTIFESGKVPAQALRWNLRDQTGRPVANGVYLYLVTAYGLDGEPVRSDVKKLVLMR
jgi:hypothetical protein